MCTRSNYRIVNDVEHTYVPGAMSPVHFVSGEVRGRGSASAHVSASAHAGQVTPPRLTDDSRGASSALSFTHLALVGVLAHEGLPEALGARRLLAGGNERVRHRGRDHLLCDGGSGNGLGQRTSWTGEAMN